MNNHHQPSLRNAKLIIISGLIGLATLSAVLLFFAPAIARSQQMLINKTNTSKDQESKNEDLSHQGKLVNLSLALNETQADNFEKAKLTVDTKENHTGLVRKKSLTQSEFESKKILLESFFLASKTVEEPLKLANTKESLSPGQQIIENSMNAEDSFIEQFY